MSELRQKIDYLEAEIAADKAALSAQVHSLKQKITSPPVIISTLISFFFVGYFMRYPKHIKGTIPWTLIKNLQTILPLILV